MNGTGDHENFFVSSNLKTDIEGEHQTYKNCDKIAVRVKEAEKHVMWPARTAYTLLFSKLTEIGRKFYSGKQLDEIEHTGARFHFSKDIKAEYGLVLIAVLRTNINNISSVHCFNKYEKNEDKCPDLEVSYLVK